MSDAAQFQTGVVYLQNWTLLLLKKQRKFSGQNKRKKKPYAIVVQT